MPRAKATSSRLRRRINGETKASHERPDGRLWKIVNSSFFLWMLSTLFVSFGTWQYTLWSEQRQKIEANAAAIKRLDLEISERLRIAGNRLVLQSLPGSNNDNIPMNPSLRLLTLVLRPPSEEFVMFPEYSKRGLLSLEVELRDMLPVDEAICVARAIALTRELMGPKSALRNENLSTAIDRINEIANLRWEGDAHLALFQRRVVQLLKQPEPKLELCSVKPKK